MEKRNMKTLKLFALSSVLVIAGCGSKETIIKEVLVTVAPTTTEATLPPKKVQTNKYDEYLVELRNYSGQANAWSDDDLIQMGHLVCEAFDGGNSLDEVIKVFSDNSSGSYDDELFAGAIIGAVVYICPEHKESVQAQL